MKVEAQMKVITYLALLLFVTSAVFADTETINPDGDPSPNNWILVNSTKHGALSDAADGTYIWTGKAGSSEKVSMSDVGKIGNRDTIDSVVIHMRGRKNFGQGTATIKMRIFRGAIKYCDAPNIDLTASIADYAFDGFASPPTSAGACSGSWTKALVDSLDIQINAFAAGDDPRIVKSWAVIHFTKVVRPQIVMKD